MRKNKKENNKYTFWHSLYRLVNSANHRNDNLTQFEHFIFFNKPFFSEGFWKTFLFWRLEWGWKWTNRRGKNWSFFNSQRRYSPLTGMNATACFSVLSAFFNPPGESNIELLCRLEGDKTGTEPFRVNNNPCFQKQSTYRIILFNFPPTIFITQNKPRYSSLFSKGINFITSISMFILFYSICLFYLSFNDLFQLICFPCFTHF